MAVSRGNGFFEVVRKYTFVQTCVYVILDTLKKHQIILQFGKRVEINIHHFPEYENESDCMIRTGFQKVLSPNIGFYI